MFLLSLPLKAVLTLCTMRALLLFLSLSVARAIWTTYGWRETLCLFWPPVIPWSSGKRYLLSVWHVEHGPSLLLIWFRFTAFLHLPVICHGAQRRTVFVTIVDFFTIWTYSFCFSNFNIIWVHLFLPPSHQLCILVYHSQVFRVYVNPFTHHIYCLVSRIVVGCYD